ncbi:MAG TPA: 16S rRNA (cytosine(967)-C(5))-methyltransferase RsmB [Kofleriaceae bacterium]|nr:16S rRNA (cytosine(967)-C(5))-methyltransferase RsmB [Kofleriaceae bacterium]
MSARDVARRVLARVEKGGAYATLALDAELSRAGLDERDRRLATELTYGALRNQLRLERALAAHADLGRAPAPVRHALVIAAYQLLMMRIPPHAAVDDAVGAVRAVHGAKLAGFCNAVLRKLAATGEPPLPAEPTARLATLHSLPAWIVDELAAQLPAGELADACAALSAPPALWIRVNRARAAVDEVIAALAGEGAEVEATPLAPYALAVRGLGNPAASPSFQAGLWTVQDLGAQLVGELATPLPGPRVLDACAGVGGKTTQLAEAAAAAGVAADITALDRAASKLELLAAAAGRLGLSGIRTEAIPLEASPVAAYDLIVVDAPCSGLGVLRRHPEAKARIMPPDVADLARVQARLLDAAVARLAPGGVLVYAVCTLTRAEGPDQLAALLARHPSLTVEPAALAPEVVSAGALRTWPHRHGADGFFAVRLRRAA